MFLEFLQFLVRFILKIFGFGLSDVGEFEPSLNFRVKINRRVQKEKDDGLPLFEGSLQEAYKIAEEVNGILLVIFLNSNCGDSRQFESSVLKDETFRIQIRDISFKTPMIVLSDITNHYHFKDSMSFKIQQFPAIFIKTKYQEKFQTILCYEGFLDTAKVLGLVQSVLLACEAEIAQAAEISAVRALQNEQDAAYLKSLEIDKEKLRKKLSNGSDSTIAKIDTSYVTKENTNEFEEDNSNIDAPNVTKCELKERISRALLDVEDEPATGTSGIFRFQFLFPDGTRKIRNFGPDSTTKTLFDFIFSSGVELRSEMIAIRSIEPPVEILENNSIIPLKDINGMGKGIKLFIDYL